MPEHLSWKQVVKTHRNIAGISTKKGLVKSLLCNAGKDQLYPNKITKNKIVIRI